MGITPEEIEKCNTRKNYESIARKLQIIFAKDVIENSSKQVIRMSGKVSKAMHTIRNINNEKIVNYVVLKEDSETYPKAIKILMNRFADILMQGNRLQEVRNANENIEFARDIIAGYEGTPDEGFARYVAGVRPEEYDFVLRIIRGSTRQAIEDEQERARNIVLTGEEFIPSEEYPHRDARIQRYINYYKTKGITDEYSDEEKKEDIEEELSAENREGTIAFERKLALEFGAKYIASLNDFEFFKLLQDTGIITEKQASSLTRKYKDIGIEGLKQEVHETIEFRQIADEQKQATAQIEADEEEK